MTEFLSKKTKAFIVFLFSLIALGIFPFVTYGISLVLSGWDAVLYCVTLIVVTILLHILGKNTPVCYVISFALNTIGIGLIASAYYTEKGIEPNLFGFFLAVLPAAGVLLLAYLMLQVFARPKKDTLITALIINGILMVIAVNLWIFDGGIVFSFGLFSLVISLCYLCVFVITIGHDERAVMRDVSFGSFGAFIIISIVVLCTLYDGDSSEGSSDYSHTSDPYSTVEDMRKKKKRSSQDYRY